MPTTHTTRRMPHLFASMLAIIASLALTLTAPTAHAAAPTQPAPTLVLTAICADKANPNLTGGFTAKVTNNGSTSYQDAYDTFTIATPEKGISYTMYPAPGETRTVTYNNMGVSTLEIDVFRYYDQATEEVAASGTVTISVCADSTPQPPKPPYRPKPKVTLVNAAHGIFRVTVSTASRVTWQDGNSSGTKFGRKHVLNVRKAGSVLVNTPNVSRGKTNTVKFTITVNGKVVYKAVKTVKR